MLIASMLCLVLSLGLMAYTLFALAEISKEQYEFERLVTTTLDKYVGILDRIADRQTRTETIVMEGQQLRLTLNEIEEYNKKQQSGVRKQKRYPRNLPIGGP